MINLKVIHIKSATRYIGAFILTVIIILMLTQVFFKTDIKALENNFDSKNDENFKLLNKYTFLSPLQIGLPAINNKNLEGNIEEKKTKISSRGDNIFKRVMKVELALLDNLTDEMKSKEKVNNSEVEKEENKDNVELASKNVKVEKVEERNIEATYTQKFEGIKIKNQSSYKLTKEILKADYLLKNCKDIVIFHTHTCESYTKSKKYNYKMTGNYRTTDLNYSVARVGEELKKQLEEYDFNVIHNQTLHDYPAYNGSYDRSLKTIEKVLKENKNVDIVIDLHRDAVGNGKDYGPTVKINGESVAQLMLVIGTDGGGLWHPNWKNNLKTAVRIQKKAEELYPGLFRPMIVRDSRYNQQVRDGAFIIEVGATGNTLDETLASMKYFALILKETFK